MYELSSESDFLVSINDIEGMINSLVLVCLS